MYTIANVAFNTYNSCTTLVTPLVTSSSTMCNVHSDLELGQQSQFLQYFKPHAKRKLDPPCRIAFACNT